MHPDQRINLGNLFQQTLSVALNETAGHDKPLDATFALLLGGIPEGFQRLIPRRREKAAGVDHQHLGQATGFSDDGAAGVGQQAEHLLRVDEVLRTAE
jgi:hypothetical protein